jgi:hypothetical protein
VSTRTLRRMCAAGEVPFRRVGRQLRFQLALLVLRDRHLTVDAGSSGG